MSGTRQTKIPGGVSITLGNGPEARMTNYSEWKMLEFIHQENMARFQSQLAAATTETHRTSLKKIISDEIAAYAQTQGGRPERD
jgi:hypothetical protein